MYKFVEVVYTNFTWFLMYGYKSDYLMKTCYLIVTAFFCGLDKQELC